MHAVVLPPNGDGKSEVGHPAGILSAESDTFLLRLLSRFVASPLNLTAGDHPEPQPTYTWNTLEDCWSLAVSTSLKKEPTLFAVS